MVSKNSLKDIKERSLGELVIKNICILIPYYCTYLLPMRTPFLDRCVYFRGQPTGLENGVDAPLRPAGYKCVQNSVRT